MTTVSKGNSIEIDVVRAALHPDYEILEELGRGGMAIVYRARELALDRQVAIKVLPAMLAMDQDFVERFTHEARTAGKLEHPNIVPIYRVGSSGHVIYFVMKLLAGQSLSRVLRERGRLSVGEVRRILIETAGALGYAAKRNVVHRDIKPDNILLDSEGRCVITDFGIAKAPGGAQTAAGTSLGTPRYMSPEHAQGVPLDGRSDMYSLGVVAYQCLTGRIPYDADDPFAILYKHINEPLPRPDLGSDEEFALFAVIERMLAKKAEDRFQSADDLIKALGGHVAEPTLVSQSLPSMLVAAQPTEIIPTPTYGTRMRRFWTQDWRSWAGLSAITVGGMVLLLLMQNAKEPAAAAPPSNTASKTPVGSTTQTGDTTRRAAGDTTRRPDSAAPGVATKGADSGTGTKSAAPRGTSGQRTGSKTTGITATKTPPAAISAARRGLTSRCPAAPGRPSLMVVAPEPTDRSTTTLQLRYDVCGLRAGAAFSTRVVFRKIERITPPPPVVFDFPDIAETNREPRRRAIDLSRLSPGRYYLDVLITDESGDRYGETVDFRLNNR